MVQHATTLGADRKCLPRRVRDELLSVAGRLARDGETQLKQSPGNPGRFIQVMSTLANKKKPRDTNQLAWQIVQEATGQAPPEPKDTRNPAAVAMAKLGAAKGGKARAKNLSPERRVEIARKAAKTRWKR